MEWLGNMELDDIKPPKVNEVKTKYRILIGSRWRRRRGCSSGGAKSDWTTVILFVIVVFGCLAY
jgi:hypothetical protein